MSAMIGRSVTTLQKWSCGDKQLPEVDQIKAIHIYDFDNTRKWSEMLHFDLSELTRVCSLL